ncbi:MAG TPA: MFS transporter [Micromonospora sp.]
MEAPVSDETRAHSGPATFREVFGQPEFRALYAANALSWIGDYIAKAAVTVLVYQQTDSVALSAAAFAVSFLPWLIGGPLLAAVAERHPYRTVLVVCDLARMVLVALVAIPNQPVETILALLFVTTLANPPSQAARSALTPLLLTGDRLVLGLSLTSSTGQAAQVGGYVAGAAIATYDPTLALLLNAATFGVSALIIRIGVRQRPAALADDDRSHLLQETADGFRMVFGTPVLRAIAILVFAAMLFAIVPEGLAAAWAAEQTGDDAGRGAAQAMIMTAHPVGFILGSVVVGRFVQPRLRRILIRPFAILGPLALVPALLDPTPIVVALLSAICGFAVAGLLPVANSLFVQALPHGFRARAFGVMGTGVQVVQGASVLLTGLLAEQFTVPGVVGTWSLVGVLLMVAAVAAWPSSEQFDTAIAAATRSSDTTPARTAGVAAPAEPVVGAGGDTPAEPASRPVGRPVDDPVAGHTAGAQGVPTNTPRVRAL